MDQPEYSQRWARRLLLDLAEHLAPSGNEVREGRAVGVPDERLLALYPFDYEQWNIDRLVVNPTERMWASPGVQESSRLLAEGYWSIIHFTDSVNAEPSSRTLHNAVVDLMLPGVTSPVMYLPKILLLALDLLAHGEAGPAATVESMVKVVSNLAVQEWTNRLPDFQQLVEALAANLQGSSSST